MDKAKETNKLVSVSKKLNTTITVHDKNSDIRSSPDRQKVGQTPQGAEIYFTKAGSLP